MADRLTAAFSPFDVLVFTLAGAVVIAGAWWGIDGVPADSPSAAAVVGLVAASYLAGVLVAVVSGVLWTGVWGRDQARSPFFKAFDSAFSTSESRLDARLRAAFEDISDLNVRDRSELIRSVLRQRKLDSRYETMNTVAWVSQSLATAAFLLAVLFTLLTVINGDPGRLLPAAGGMLIATIGFGKRAHAYQIVAARTLKFEALALVDPPKRMRQHEADPAAAKPPDAA